MPTIDFQSVDELNGLYESLKSVRVILNELLDAEADVMFDFYAALSEIGVKTSLGEKGMLVELQRAGKGDLVKRYIEIGKDVTKAKNVFKVALEAINLKKHINNVSPH